jgi:hypothetical protein
VAGCRSQRSRADLKGASVPTATLGLVARLDAFVDLVADRRGLALDADARLAPADALAAARAVCLATHGTAVPPRPGPAAAGAVEFLRLLAQAVGLLRVRGSRLEVTTLRPAWSKLDDGLRAGLVFAAWCHRVPWSPVLGPGPGVEALARGRLWVLRLLFGLPAGVDVAVAGLAATIGEGLDLGPADRLAILVAAAFLDPLGALGAAELEPAPPHPPVRFRLGPRARVVIGSALIAAGEEVPLSTTTTS